eukprot:TRINITY_DN33264_c0_g1_i1.p1 TRINITY_DN33264_c0_g1~~TRINITY_DN33264_c0_g1_i1.p1  ORF type:complete len:354 (+),score=81.84 TRINITY_DN33264_c0_g1_i1:366-1427(+)
MALAGVEDSAGKKIRKPYTITKSRESWTDQEHEKFLEALQLFDRDWKKIEAFVGTKTVIQIRSHAQKYFLKVQKNGTREHVPPPRPKRKAAHPYPQKAPKNVSISQTAPVLVTVSQPDMEYYQLPGTTSMLQKAGSSYPATPWVHHSVPPIDVPFLQKDAATVAVTTQNICSTGSTENCACTWQSQPDIPDEGNESLQVRVKPDFSQVYQFIGSVFDPDATDHLKNLQKLDPIDLETVLLLMRNLCINLSSPEFEEHKLLFSTYDTNDSDGSDVKDQFKEGMAAPLSEETQTKGLEKVKQGDQPSQHKINDKQVSADSLRCNPNESTVTGTSSFQNVDETGEITSYFSSEDTA